MYTYIHTHIHVHTHIRTYLHTYRTHDNAYMYIYVYIRDVSRIFCASVSDVMNFGECLVGGYPNSCIS